MKITPLFALLGVGFLSLGALQAQDRISRPDYIMHYQSLAIEQMEIYGIPASIKIAQGVYESDNGNSRLARQANNHFGIKCKSTWTGETISHDDDAVGECFRKYASAEASYLDHSEFLDKSARYQDLFKLDPLDYRGWALGLKKAGYATNPKYAETIIKIIEDNELYRLDQGELLAFEGTAPIAVPATPAAPTTAVAVAAPPAAPAPVPVQSAAPAVAPPTQVDAANYAVVSDSPSGRHKVYHNNGSEFVLVAAGDTYASLAQEFRVNVSKLLKYNDVNYEVPLQVGDMIYIKTKAKRSQNGKLIHVAKEGESLHSISQQYGIRLRNLSKINRRPEETILQAGQQIRLM